MKLLAKDVASFQSAVGSGGSHCCPTFKMPTCYLPSPSQGVPSGPVSGCCSVQSVVSGLQVFLSGSPPADSSDPD